MQWAFNSLHSGCRSTSSLPDTQSFVKKEGNSTSHLINNCSDANFATSEHHVKTGRIHKNSQGTHHNDKGSRKTHALSTVVGSWTSLEITYCSLDDIDDATSNFEMKDLPSSIPMPRTLRFGGHKGCKSPYGIDEGTPVTPTNAQEDVSVKKIIDEEALYAKPDMSRKTRKIHRSAESRGVTKQHGQGDRAPVGEDSMIIRIAMIQKDGVAENDVGSDILVDGPIYGNSASILNR